MKWTLTQLKITEIDQQISPTKLTKQYGGTQPEWFPWNKESSLYTTTPVS